MGKRIKLSVIYKDSIKACYGNIINNEPLEIEFDKEYNFIKEDIIIYTERVENSKNTFLLNISSINENKVTFIKAKQIESKLFNNHFLELSHIFNVKEYNIEDEEIYKDYANKINIQELNSTASRLKEVYTRDDVDNRELISFLIDINAKIDEILYILKPKTTITGAIEYKSLLISEDGIFFVSNSNIEKENVMIYTTIRDGGGFFSFGAVCSVKEFIKTENYIIYEAVFKNISYDIKDKIIKYMFRLEREMLKEANK